MVMSKVEVIKRTKIRQAELVQLYKKDKECDGWPNNDDSVNKEDDDKGYESENCGEPLKNYKDEIYITNNELVVVLQQNFEENIVWDFGILKLGLTKRNIFFQCIVHVVKFINHGWRKKIYCAS